MIDWIFILIALHGTSATADSVGFESESVCTAYARGALSRPEIQRADIQAAQCVSLRTGRHIDFRPPVPIVTPTLEIHGEPVYVLSHDQLMNGLRSAHNAGRRAVLLEKKQ